MAVHASELRDRAGRLRRKAATLVRIGRLQPEDYTRIVLEYDAMAHLLDRIAQEIEGSAPSQVPGRTTLTSR